MKTITVIFTMLLSSLVFAGNKDPRINAAKREAARLFRGHVTTRDPVTKVNVLEQNNSFFLAQVITKNKKYFCFVFEVNIINNVPEISVVAKNNDAEDAFIQECSEKPTATELFNLKLLNGWPTQ